MMLKRIRKICLEKDCKNKATHFGINGRKSNCLCEKHYREYIEHINIIKNLSNEIREMLQKYRYL